MAVGNLRKYHCLQLGSKSSQCKWSLGDLTVPVFNVSKVKLKGAQIGL
jgi:hypothetical protein